MYQTMQTSLAMSALNTKNNIIIVSGSLRRSLPFKNIHNIILCSFIHSTSGSLASHTLQSQEKEDLVM